uniref:Uncharacterized protein n=1 Tax=Opuntia streptacantha TaxID=393608 RepID=A0A7C8YGW8_OPUST
MNWDIPGCHCVQSGLAKSNVVVKPQQQYIQPARFHQYIIATIYCISGPISKRATTPINTSCSNTYKVFAIMGNDFSATDWRPLPKASLPPPSFFYNVSPI